MIIYVVFSFMFSFLRFRFSDFNILLSSSQHTKNTTAAPPAENQHLMLVQYITTEGLVVSENLLEWRILQEPKSSAKNEDGVVGGIDVGLNFREGRPTEAS